MNVGQKSFVVFVSRFGSSAVGFVAMIYLARNLGSGVLGVYFLIVTVVSWLKLGCDMGIKISITKRISEGKNKDEFAVAGLILVSAAFFVLSSMVFLFGNQVNQYLGEPLYQYVILILGARVTHMYVGAVARGENLVHLEGLLKLINTVSTRGAQILLAITFGLSTVGLLLGELLGFILVSVLGVVLMATYFGRSPNLSVPDREQFESLFGFAKFSWMGMVRGSTYNRMDTAVLGFFVSNSLIGIYSICWNISAVLTLFSKSLLSVLFPEMSKLSEEGNRQRVKSHLEDALSYTGLLVIPGFVGAVVVGKGILNMYGGEFRQGYVILLILSGAALFQSYYLQLINTMDALNRPELSFRVNSIFVVMNISLNFALVYLYGWVGAAFATLFSTAVASAVSFRILSNILKFSFPYRKTLAQVSSAVIMGVVVHLFVQVLSRTGFNTQRAVPVLVAVGLGGMVYFALLISISSNFRETILSNLSVDID